jgi:DNA-binding MarR family transcriptional regulator
MESVMDETVSNEYTRDLLEAIAQDPNTTQASIAIRMGVAVGTVNWYLKRLIAKGYVKVKRAERRKLRYIITAEGLSLRARLTMKYIENSMALYRQVRQTALEVLADAKQHGHGRVVIDGEGDIAEVCRLTCLELGLKVEGEPQDGLPILQINGSEIKMVRSMIQASDSD